MLPVLRKATGCNIILVTFETPLNLEVLQFE